MGPGDEGKLLPVLPLPYQLLLPLHPGSGACLLCLRPPGGRAGGDTRGPAAAEKQTVSFPFPETAAGSEAGGL